MTALMPSTTRGAARAISDRATPIFPAENKDSARLSESFVPWISGIPITTGLPTNVGIKWFNIISMLNVDSGRFLIENSCDAILFASTKSMSLNDMASGSADLELGPYRSGSIVSYGAINILVGCYGNDFTTVRPYAINRTFNDTRRTGVIRVSNFDGSDVGQPGPGQALRGTWSRVQDNYDLGMVGGVTLAPGQIYTSTEPIDVTGSSGGYLQFYTTGSGTLLAQVIGMSLTANNQVVVAQVSFPNIGSGPNSLAFNGLSPGPVHLVFANQNAAGGANISIVDVAVITNHGA